MFIPYRHLRPSFVKCQASSFTRESSQKVYGNHIYWILETVRDFIFLGSKITADGDCSHEIKRCLFLGRKAMIDLENILKSRDISLPTKLCVVKAIVFPVFMYGCESWTIKKATCQITDDFEQWFWEDSWEALGLQGDQTSQLTGLELTY